MAGLVRWWATAIAASRSSVDQAPRDSHASVSGRADVAAVVMANDRAGHPLPRFVASVENRTCGVIHKTDDRRSSPPPRDGSSRARPGARRYVPHVVNGGD